MPALASHGLRAVSRDLLIRPQLAHDTIQKYHAVVKDWEKAHDYHRPG
jgi:hypothetical protein